MRLPTILLITNAVTLAVLVLALHYSRLPQRLWQRVAVEHRVPGLRPVHELNRNYRAGRELFRIYPRKSSGVLILGDSHVQSVCWHELLVRSDVGCRGISGDSLDGIRMRLADDRDASPQAVVLMGGTNDLLRGASAKEVAARYLSLLDHARSIWPRAMIVLIAPPAVARWVERSGWINLQVQQVTSRLQRTLPTNELVRLVDLGPVMHDLGGNLRPEMTSDGVHLSAAAYSHLGTVLNALLPPASGKE